MKTKMFRFPVTVSLAALACALVAAPASLAAKHNAGSHGAGHVVTLKDGLKYQDIVVGKGAMPRTGQTVTVDYVGTLTNGMKFDASKDHGGTFQFTLGVGQVIKGWDEGVKTMRVGGDRKLTVPASLGYGPNGMPPVIPPNATLIFDVKLIAVH